MMRRRRRQRDLTPDLRRPAPWRVDVRIEERDYERAKRHLGAWINAARFDVPQAITDAPREAEIEIIGVIAASDEIAERFVDRLFTRVGVTVLSVRARRSTSHE